MEKLKKRIRRSILLIFGSAIMGLGIAMAINGGHGADPFATFWEGLSNNLPITIGQANLLVSFVLIIICLMLDKKQINIGTIINPFIVGISTDTSLIFINGNNYQMLGSIIGVLVIGIGIGIYTTANFGKGAYDAITFGLSNKFNIKYFKIRMIGDSLFLLTGYLLGASIGISTFIAVLCLGFIIQFTNKFIKASFLKDEEALLD